jgi:hypothetical protein
LYPVFSASKTVIPERLLTGLFSYRNLPGGAASAAEGAIAALAAKSADATKNRRVEALLLLDESR